MDIGKMIKDNPVRSGLIALVVIILAIFMFCGGGCGGRTDAEKTEEKALEKSGVVLGMNPLVLADLKRALAHSKSLQAELEAAEATIDKMKVERDAAIKRGIDDAWPDAVKAKTAEFLAEKDSLKKERTSQSLAKTELATEQAKLAKEQATFAKGQAALEKAQLAFEAQKVAYWHQVEIERLKTGGTVPVPVEPKLEKKTDPPVSTGRGKPKDLPKVKGKTK